MKRNEPYGRRDGRSTIIRLIGGVVLGLMVLVLSLTVGRREQAAQLEDLASNAPDGWAINRFRDPVDRLPIPPKKQGVKRFVYISNSHAKTGGHVARHLQRLLDALAPGGYEILDMSDAGIFAPDMLERTLAAMDYEPDAVLLAVAYISFSDRMKLARQSFSARSFFKAPVYHRLPASFWWWNYDLSIYGDTLVGRFLPLFRYRNDIRDDWEQPLSQYLKRVTGDRWIQFLEIDENQFWKFPSGFDRDLFDWSLYSIGREGHLADMKSLADACRKNRVPLMAFNLPIDWNKSSKPFDGKDVAAYRQSLNDLFSDALLYTDYQDRFPKSYTTYDPLHPSWHGARLHALDMVFKLNRAGLLGRTYNEDKIVDLFLKLDDAVSLEYKAALNGDYPPLDIMVYRRYDFFEPDNARHLLRELATFSPGKDEDRTMVREVSHEIGKWRKLLDRSVVTTRTWETAPFDRAFRAEMKRASARIRLFEKEFIRVEQRKLAEYPLPEVDEAFLKETKVSSGPVGEVLQSHYELPNDQFVVTYRLKSSDRILMCFVHDRKTGEYYRRTDLLGNGSFILLEIFAPVRKL